MSVKTSLFDMLRLYSEQKHIPMHMPGHKRNSDKIPYLDALGAQWDITEIEGFDNLHQAHGILNDSMNSAAKLWGSQRAFHLINGSTCGILAAVRGTTHSGGKVIVARNCHKSVYHAIELCRLSPIYLLAPTEKAFGIYGSINPDDIQTLLSQERGIELVVITSPTYEGVISDIASIASICHEYNVPLLVDEAHGAHLGFDGNFYAGSISAGADIVVQSLHKTLPSLTQTAIMHICSDRVCGDEIARQLQIFETSSPSYLLLASIDGCIRLLEKERKPLFEAWTKRLAEFRIGIECLQNISILFYNDSSAHDTIWGFDPSKIIISTKCAGITGVELMNRLREDFCIELEMASGDYAVAMTGLTEADESLKSLAKALCEIDKSLQHEEEKATDITLMNIPERVYEIDEALEKDYCFIETQFASGYVCADYLWVYPPGVPILVPGEMIDENVLSIILSFLNKGLNVSCTRSVSCKKIAVLVKPR